MVTGHVPSRPGRAAGRADGGRAAAHRAGRADGVSGAPQRDQPHGPPGTAAWALGGVSAGEDLQVGRRFNAVPRDDSRMLSMIDHKWRAAMCPSSAERSGGANNGC